MVLKYNGEVSSPQPLHGGTIQGSWLGIILFLVEISDAGMPVPEQPRVNDVINDVISVSAPLPAISKNEIRLKYVDDQTQGEVINLKASLDLNAETGGPRTFHDRHGHVLPPERSLLQQRLNQIQQYADIHHLKVNQQKTKLIPFNFQ